VAGALAVITISLLAVLTVGTSASFNVQMLLRSENAQFASLLADSAIQQAIAELTRRPDWGSAPATDRIEYNGPIERSRVRLTFDRTAGVPFSTNNQTGANSMGWGETRLLSNRRVPDKRVHLVAVGECRGVRRIREAVVHVPNYTVSLGSTGKVTLLNSLVGSLPSAADLARLDSDPSLLGPGDLVTNSQEPDSVVLDVNSRVAGNVQTRGNVVVRSGSTVGGEVRPHHGAAMLPEFRFDDYDPALSDALNFQLLPVGVNGPATLVGLVRCPGSAVVNGDLNLDNCLLFVVGDLTVRGGVRGSGAIICKGKTTVQGGSTLTSDDSVALLSQGDINLIGDVPDRYTFQGIVYTRGNFTTRNFTVVGGFIADGATTDTGRVTMEASRAFHTAMTARVDFNVPVQIVIQVASTNPPAIQEWPNDPSNSDSIDYGLSPVVGQPPQGAPVTPDNYDTPYEAAHFNNPAGEWDWWNPALVEITRERVNGVVQPVYYLKYTEGGVFRSIREVTRDGIVNRICDLSEQKCPAYNDGIAQGDDGAAIQPDTSGDLAGLTRETRPYRYRFYTLLLSARVPSDNGSGALDGDTRPWELRNQFSGANGVSANFSFDPNRFLTENEKVRIAAWTEY
jgi:hypothetical protein